ncbi:signal peptidase I [Gloeobacter kilaueensis]|uniref:Signal peptidase I n=1 Tax=Gloeobacter kilaueensis (strain ATCC BAA-2537 / CCAP 1431/1 / ULC 316 / JS1) TaxID=1183438 RepID=U5QKU0_GLOK1|nr:signal peptidase I [Gloeobacter kilaueensis]AGY59597.1 signal peptidase I [Gloeobacter kilaueensis JS1]
MSNSPSPPPENKFWTFLKSQRENVQSIAVALILTFTIQTFAAQAFYIPSGSMEPTLLINDRLMVEKISYDFSSPQRGQIIVFTPPKNGINTNDQPFIKRVIGLPGDTVAVHEGKVYINSKPLDEKYIAEPPAYEMQPVKVPDNMYFVMGDNRNNSFDSHIWGFLPRKNVIGRAVFRFWPLDRLGPLN